MVIFFSCNAKNAERGKMGNEVENAGTIKWHPGFYGGMKLEMKSSEGCFTYEVERVLSDEPVRMDMLIIKKNENVAIDNPIAILLLMRYCRSVCLPTRVLIAGLRRRTIICVKL